MDKKIFAFQWKPFAFILKRPWPFMSSLLDQFQNTCTSGTKSICASISSCCCLGSLQSPTKANALSKPLLENTSNPNRCIELQNSHLFPPPPSQKRAGSTVYTDDSTGRDSSVLVIPEGLAKFPYEDLKRSTNGFSKDFFLGTISKCFWTNLWVLLN